MAKSSTKGFSLMELMVAVAIIAILSLMAVPAYQGFQARARQKEGFHLANTFYTAAQATHTEFGFYPGDFVQTGFQPQGRLGYRLRTQNGTLIPSLPNDDGCLNTDQPCDCGGDCPNYREWEEIPGNVGTETLGAVGCDWGASCGPPFVTDDTFQILVCGYVNTRSALRDQYGMNENKQLTMCLDGLK